jgi:hypothetical protein
MKWAGTKDLRMLLLSIWLIATGLLSFVQVTFAQMGLVMAAGSVRRGAYRNLHGGSYFIKPS